MADDYRPGGAIDLGLFFLSLFWLPFSFIFAFGAVIARLWLGIDSVSDLIEMLIVVLLLVASGVPFIKLFL
jgi:hypothetical protein